MKLDPKNGNRQAQGSILLVMLIISAILGITLASYLIMAQNQNASVMRSQVWNSAIPIAEAGVEDAMQLLNKYAGNFDAVTNWPSMHSEDGWTMIAPQVFYVRRFFSENYYDVYITNSPWQNPSIYSVGYALWRNPYGNAPVPLSAAVGVDYGSTRTVLPRNVTVGTRIDPLFNVAMAAKLTIDFAGKNVNTDSFHSMMPLYSDWQASLGYGLYPAGQPSKTLDHGDVVTDHTIINSMNVGNSKIKGQVKTGPKGTIAIGPGGSVGDKAWVDGGSKGIKPGFSSDDMNILFPDVIMPSTTWMPVSPAPTVVNGKTYQYVFNSDGDYTIPGLTGNIYVSTNKSIRLKITGNVSLTGSNDEIRLGPGAKMKLYMVGASCKIAGNGVVNDSGNANNFYYFGLPTNTQLQFQGNASFTGAIYAPSAAFTLGGGGQDTYDFIGASVTKTVKMNGHYNFHYDENLKNNGMGFGFVPTKWAEK